MFDEKIKTPQLLHGLKYQRGVVNKLLKIYHEYNSFLEEVLKIKEIFSNDITIPVKDVAQRLKISPTKVRKYLEQIYDDIIEFLRDDERKPIRPEPTMYSLSVKDRYNKYLFVENMQLDIIPRVGEVMELYFLYPFFRYTYFEVCKVYHEIDYDEHRIHIELRHKLNRFVEMKKDEDDYNRFPEAYKNELNVFHYEKGLSFKKGEWKSI